MVDAKHYRGRPRLEIEGGILRPRVERLLVAGRDRSKLVDGVLGQVDLVQPCTADEKRSPARQASMASTSAIDRRTHR